jgi:hypothetical protein
MVRLARDAGGMYIERIDRRPLATGFSMIPNPTGDLHAPLSHL